MLWTLLFLLLFVEMLRSCTVASLSGDILLRPWFLKMIYGRNHFVVCYFCSCNLCCICWSSSQFSCVIVVRWCFIIPFYYAVGFYLFHWFSSRSNSNSFQVLHLFCGFLTLFCPCISLPLNLTFFLTMSSWRDLYVSYFVLLYLCNVFSIFFLSSLYFFF